MSSLIYFDHAATSYPKPNAVIKSTINAYEEKGGNPGRSSHKLSLEAAKAVYDCRNELSKFLDYNCPERVVFTYNTTYALNMAIKGLATQNSHILISNLEHNSVLRPVYALAQNPANGIRYSSFHAECENENEIVENFVNSLQKDTKLCVLTIASNICGRILPIAKIGAICKQRKITIIADGAQAVGIIPLNFENLNIDVLCIPGHKGLLGPTGTGAMITNTEIEPNCIIEGGNGINSKDLEMSGDLPERLEAGTINTVGIVALCEGIKYINKTGIEYMYRQSSHITEYINCGLKNIHGVTIYGDYAIKTPVILFNINDHPAEEVARILSDNSICVRGGFHCAPIAHKALQTGENGAVRASFGHLNTFDEANKFLRVVSKIK